MSAKNYFKPIKSDAGNRIFFPEAEGSATHQAAHISEYHGDGKNLWIGGDYVISRTTVKKLLPFLKTFAETGSLKAPPPIVKLPSTLTTSGCLKPLKKEILTIARFLERKNTTPKTFMQALRFKLSKRSIEILNKMEDTYSPNATNNWIMQVLVDTGKYYIDQDGALLAT